MALEQHDPQARALEKAVDKAFEVYTEKAAAVDKLWRSCSKIVFIPGTGKPERVIDENNKNYPEFAIATMEKEEAEREWNKARYAHGNALHDLRK